MASDSERRVGDVLISEQRPGMVEVVLDRPEAVNALDDGIVRGLEYAVGLCEDRDTTLLSIRGAGGNFCAGADLKFVSQLLPDLDALFAFIKRIREISTRLAEGPFVSLAVVEGYALAGGFELLNACDLAVASHDASIGDRHLEYALAPAGGVSVRMPRHLSSKRSRYLAYTGYMLTGEEAASWGVVSHAWEQDVLDQNLENLVDRLLSRSAAALRTYKRMLLDAEQQSFEVAMQREFATFSSYYNSQSDGHSGVARFVDAPNSETTP